MTVQHISNAITVLDVAHAQPRRDVVRKPDAPDAIVPHFLHRGHDGFMAVERKVGDDWQTLGNVKASHIGGLFSDEVIAEACQVDSYFSLHGMYSSGRYRQKTNLPALAPFCRNLKSVRWLTCCHVDLDAYKAGMDSHAAIAAVMRLVDAGTLPPPSLFTTSRGAWCIWLLIDQENCNSPLRSYSSDGSTINRWSRIQNALHKTCANISSDPATKHAASVTRIPGSINSKNAQRVSYSFHVNAFTGRPYQYTLPQMELAMLCDVPLPPPRITYRRASSSPEITAVKRRGWHGRWQRVDDVLCQLRNMRGGWKCGHRSMAIFYASTAYRALNLSTADVQRELAAHLDGIEQPQFDAITPAKAFATFRSLRVQRHGGPSHQTIADSLDVTPDESALLSVNRRTPFPCASRFSHALPPVKLSAAALTKRRRAAVSSVCASVRGLITGTMVQQHLESLGLRAALATVLRDMEQLGFRSVKSHRIKGKAPESQL